MRENGPKLGGPVLDRGDGRGDETDPDSFILKLAARRSRQAAVPALIDAGRSPPEPQALSDLWDERPHGWACWALGQHQGPRRKGKTNGSFPRPRRQASKSGGGWQASGLQVGRVCGDGPWP